MCSLCLVVQGPHSSLLRVAIFIGVEMCVFLCFFLFKHKGAFIVVCVSLCLGLCFAVFRLCFERPKSVFCVSKTLRP